MLKYELINPSDPIFFEAEDLGTAALVLTAIGGGMYGGKHIDDDSLDIPMFAFSSWTAFVEKRLGGKEPDAETILSLERISHCMKSFHIEKGHTRSSMNDICRAAHEFAKKIDRRIESLRAAR